MTAGNCDAADCGGVDAVIGTTLARTWSNSSASLCNDATNGRVVAGKKTSSICIMREDLIAKCLNSSDIDINFILYNSLKGILD